MYDYRNFIPYIYPGYFYFNLKTNYPKCSQKIDNLARLFDEYNRKFKFSLV